MTRSLVGLLGLVAIMACAAQDGEPGDGSTVSSLLDEHGCVTLLAGQHIDVGEVCVSTDGENIYLEYWLDAPWTLTETQTWIGWPKDAYPQAKKGNPIPGQFPVKSGDISGASHYTVVYPYDAIAGRENPGCGDEVYIVAHSSLRNTTTGASETAWPDGEDMPGNNWAMGLPWTITCDLEIPEEEEQCETAFGYLAAVYDGVPAATCFIDDGFGRWGWTNYLPANQGNTFVLQLRAGAAHCANGDDVGTATFTYDATGLSVAYAITGGWNLREAHFYAGDASYPSKGEKLTVAPGQYPGTCDSVQATGCTGTLASSLADHVIAHATVCRMVPVNQ